MVFFQCLKQWFFLLHHNSIHLDYDAYVHEEERRLGWGRFILFNAVFIISIYFEIINIVKLNFRKNVLYHILCAGPSIHLLYVNYQKNRSRRTALRNLKKRIGSYMQYTITAPEDTCSICYDTFVRPVNLSCGHEFCEDCVRKWFVTSQTNRCPYCAQDVLRMS